MARSGLLIVAPIIVVLGLAQPGFSQVPTKSFLTKDGKRPDALFAPGVAVGKTVYIAGKGDYRPNGSLEEKVNNCLGEIRKTLQVAGLDLKDVVKSFVYLEDHDQYAEFNKHYARFFEHDPPARTTLGVSQVPGDSRLEITCIAYSDPSERKCIGTAPAGLPFSPAVLAGQMLYVAGKGDQLPSGGHPATFEEQVRQSMRNVEATLKQAGLDFRHVVMSHVFLDRSADLEVVNKVYNQFFEAGNQPACATVFVDWIPGGSHVEVTCFATTELASRKVVRLPGQNAGPAEGMVTASPAVWAGNTLFVSSLSGRKPGGGAPASDLSEQVHQMARNHTAVLDAAGLKLDDIVAGWVYLRDMGDYNPMNAIYRQYFSRGPGVRTCLMPNGFSDRNDLRVHASFIAAKTH